MENKNSSKYEVCLGSKEINRGLFFMAGTKGEIQIPLGSQFIVRIYPFKDKIRIELLAEGREVVYNRNDIMLWRKGTPKKQIKKEEIKMKEVEEVELL